jgi:hypothetical protein
VSRLAANGEQVDAPGSTFFSLERALAAHDAQMTSSTA